MYGWWRSITGVVAGPGWDSGERRRGAGRAGGKGFVRHRARTRGSHSSLAAAELKSGSAKPSGKFTGCGLNSIEHTRRNPVRQSC